MNCTFKPVRLRTSVVVALLAACAGAPVWALTPEQPLSMLFEEPVQTTSGSAGRMSAPAPGTPRCTVNVKQLQDARVNKATFGAAIFPTEDFAAHASPLFAESIRSGDAVPWLRGAMKSLPRFGVMVAEVPPGDAGAYDVSVKLAHAWTGGLNMHSHVMLEVSQPGRPGDAVRRIHGFGTKANWGGTNSEFMTVLNLALNDAAQQLATGEFAAQCAGKAP